MVKTFSMSVPLQPGSLILFLSEFSPSVFNFRRRRVKRIRITLETDTIQWTVHEIPPREILNNSVLKMQLEWEQQFQALPIITVINYPIEHPLPVREFSSSWLFLRMQVALIAVCETVCETTATFSAASRLKAFAFLQMPMFNPRSSTAPTVIGAVMRSSLESSADFCNKMINGPSAPVKTVYEVLVEPTRIPRLNFCGNDQSSWEFPCRFFAEISMTIIPWVNSVKGSQSNLCIRWTTACPQE